MGLRFLYPVYLIDSVEVTVGDQISDATMTKSMQSYVVIMVFLSDIQCNMYMYTAKAFLKSIRKSSFVRVPGAYPRKLTEKEALEMQTRTQN